jgi:hypothetical protein
MIRTGGCPRQGRIVVIVRWRTPKSSRQAIVCLAPQNGDDQGQLGGVGRWYVVDAPEGTG